MSCSCVCLIFWVVQPLSTVQLPITIQLGQGGCVAGQGQRQYDATAKLGNLGRVWGKEGSHGRHGKSCFLSPASGGPMTNTALTPHLASKRITTRPLSSTHASLSSQHGPPAALHPDISAPMAPHIRAHQPVGHSPPPRLLHTHTLPSGKAYRSGSGIHNLRLGLLDAWLAPRRKSLYGVPTGAGWPGLALLVCTCSRKRAVPSPPRRNTDRPLDRR